ncbi:MAG: hypothetical protein QOC73_366, partial [Actinomycetota bacterium]|nr:hypothetical protein [Actinomycetota bacterium]
PVEQIAVTGIRICSIDDDEEAARRNAAFAIGQYAASRVYDRLFALHGWSAAQERIRAAARDRDTAALVKAVPEAAVDAIAVACTPADFPTRLLAASQGFDHVDAVAPPWGLSDEQTLHGTRQILAGLRDLLAGPSTSSHDTERSEFVS